MKILVLEEFADGYRELLGALPHDLSYASDSLPPERDYDVLLAQPDLAAAYLKAGGQVRWIQSSWAGVRPLADALAGRDVLITGIKDLFGPQIAEYVFTYILEELRQPDRYRDAQRARRWQPQPAAILAERRLVIVGTGSIGSHLATVARTFGLSVTGVSRSGSAAAAAFDHMVPAAELHAAVADADYIVLVLPDTAAAHHLFDHGVFAAMRRQPLLFNVGRGNSIDAAALLDALEHGILRGAVLDVFDSEPLAAEHPLWAAPGVTITPHIAAVSHPRDIARVFLNNLAKFEAGKPLEFVIDPVVGY